MQFFASASGKLLSPHYSPPLQKEKIMIFELQWRKTKKPSEVLIEKTMLLSQNESTCIKTIQW